MDGTDEAFFEGDWGDKACFWYRCTKTGIGAEFFDADGGNRQSFARGK